MKRMKHKIICELEVKTKQNKQNIIIIFFLQDKLRQKKVMFKGKRGFVAKPFI